MYQSESCHLSECHHTDVTKACRLGDVPLCRRRPIGRAEKRNTDLGNISARLSISKTLNFSSISDA